MSGKPAKNGRICKPTRKKMCQEEEISKNKTSQVTVTAKETGTPPPTWVLDFPPKNVSTKIEIHEKAIGEINKETTETTENKNPEVIAKQTKETEEILKRVMNQKPPTKKTKKSKSKSSKLESLIINMGKSINQNVMTRTEEINKRLEKIEETQETKINEI